MAMSWSWITPALLYVKSKLGRGLILTELTCVHELTRDGRLMLAEPLSDTLVFLSSSANADSTCIQQRIIITKCGRWNFSFLYFFLFFFVCSPERQCPQHGKDKGRSWVECWLSAVPRICPARGSLGTDVMGSAAACWLCIPRFLVATDGGLRGAGVGGIGWLWCKSRLGCGHWELYLQRFADFKNCWFLAWQTLMII